MKRENLILFLLSAALAAVSAQFGIGVRLHDKLASQGERLARIEAKLETIESAPRSQIASKP